MSSLPPILILVLRHSLCCACRDVSRQSIVHTVESSNLPLFVPLAILCQVVWAPFPLPYGACKNRPKSTLLFSWRCTRHSRPFFTVLLLNFLWCSTKMSYCGSLCDRSFLIAFCESLHELMPRSEPIGRVHAVRQSTMFRQRTNGSAELL